MPFKGKYKQMTDKGKKSRALADQCEKVKKSENYMVNDDSIIADLSKLSLENKNQIELNNQPTDSAHQQIDIRLLQKSKNQSQGSKTTNNRVGKRLDEIVESENSQHNNGQVAEPARDRTGENASREKDCPDGGPAEDIIDGIGDHPIPTRQLPTNVRQLYGKNQRFLSGATMVELKDEIYCKDSNIREAKSALSAAIHAKELFSGVFTHDAIMQGTMSGNSYGQNGPKREYSRVLKLDEKAIEVIVDETLDYAIFKKMVKEEIKDDPNMAGDLDRFKKQLNHSLSNYISQYKRIRKESKYDRKPNIVENQI